MSEESSLVVNNRAHTGHRRVSGRRGGRTGNGHRAPQDRRPSPGGSGDFRVVERPASLLIGPGPFRIVIAVRRPRYRGRAERAAALEGWEVTSLLNKQDPVGLCAKAPRPPDLLVLSADFGRQKDLGIFRAVQRYRGEDMLLIGLVEDCEAAPDGIPDSAPDRLCDVCVAPPYKMADLRVLFSRLYTEMRGQPAPPPIARAALSDEIESDGDD